MTERKWTPEGKANCQGDYVTLWQAETTCHHPKNRGGVCWFTTSRVGETLGRMVAGLPVVVEKKIHKEPFNVN